VAEEETAKKEKKHRKKTFVIRIVIILLLIHIILVLSKCTIVEEGYEYIETPTKTYKVVTESFDNCTLREHQWSYGWEGWNPEKDQVISPVFLLENLEDKSATFTVSFAFFEQSEHPYEKYQNIDYEKIRDILPWESASMFANNIVQSIGGKEEVIISPSAVREKVDGIYWVYADVKVPSYNDCKTEITEKTVEKTEMVKERVKRNKRVTRSWWDILLDFVFR
jgi:hypothetical protein